VKGIKNTLKGLNDGREYGMTLTDKSFKTEKVKEGGTEFEPMSGFDVLRDRVNRTGEKWGISLHKRGKNFHNGRNSKSWAFYVGEK
jgi:hypothetical protein